jgi:hypothetical protein
LNAKTYNHMVVFATSLSTPTELLEHGIPI